MASMIEGETDERGFTEYVYYKKRASTTYDKAKVLAAIPEEDWLEYNIVKCNDAAITRYLKEHPEVAEKLQAYKGYTKPFLATRKKRC